MKNKAKCKLCNSIIESFHSTDYVTCKCGAISLDGGPSMLCYAVDFSNMLRVDDEGNEIVVTVKDNVKPLYNGETSKPSKQDIIGMIEEMISSYDRLPEHAKSSYITHYDQESLLLILLAILRSD